MFEKLIEAVRKYDTVIVHRHSHPDGDALGSQIGFAGIISANFPGKKVYKTGDAAGRYSFIKGSEMDEIPDGAFQNALSVILDCPTSELVSDGRFSLAASTARVDHHIYCETFTDVEIVDTSFESACGMVAEFAREQNLKLPKDAAAAIFTGMVTDSGRFRFDSTTPRTFSLASYLLSTGFDMDGIYRNLYTRDLESVLRQAEFLKKMKIYEGSCVAYIYTTVEELRAMNVQDPASISRGMVNVMSDIKGIDIWVNFTERGDKVLAELRSSCYNINPVAVKYGGGGHKKASGADVKDFNDAMRMLEDLRQLSISSKKE